MTHILALIAALAFGRVGNVEVGACDDSLLTPARPQPPAQQPGAQSGERSQFAGAGEFLTNHNGVDKRD